MRSLGFCLIVLVTATTTFAAPHNFRQDNDESLRAQALALNQVTGKTAIAGKIRSLNKDKPALRKLLTESLSIAKEHDKEKVKEKNAEPPFNYTAAWILARSAHILQDYDTGEFFYKICIEHAANLDDFKKLESVFGDLILLYDSAKKYNESLYVCEKLYKLTEDKQDEDSLRLQLYICDKMVQLLARQKKFEKALDTADEFVKRFQKLDLGWYFVRRKGEVYREWSKFDDAINEYKKAQELLEDSERENKDALIEANIKYPMTGLYVDAGQPDKAIELLDELVRNESSRYLSTFCNDLGYILADNNKRLDEAEKLVRKALELEREKRENRKKDKDDSDEDQADDDESDKDNPAYIDSLAWVYFKQKKYAEARDLMLEVVKSKQAQHVEIFDHLAEIYAAMGQKDEAVKTWQKALTLDNVTVRDATKKETIKKKIESAK